MSRETFQRQQRLLTAAQYAQVFAAARRFGNRTFTLLVRENEVGHSRLGLAISKKNLKRAVDRNRIKRLLRQSFRTRQKMLPSIDIVVMCRPYAAQLTNQQVFEQLDQQWHYIRKKLDA